MIIGTKDIISLWNCVILITTLDYKNFSEKLLKDLDKFLYEYFQENPTNSWLWKVKCIYSFTNMDEEKILSVWFHSSIYYILTDDMIYDFCGIINLFLLKKNFK